MEKINIFSRLFRSISDFDFSNVFIKEKTGKAFSFMIFGFLLFSVLTVGFYFVKIQGNIDVFVADSERMLNNMPEFNVTPDGVVFNNGITEGFYENESLIIIVDINEDEEIRFVERDDKFVLHIDEDSLYLNDVSIIEFTTLTGTHSRADVISILKSVDSIAKIVMVFSLIIAFILLMMLSLFNWLVANFVNAVFKRGVLAGDCYKVAVYAMTLPNMILIGLTFTGIKIPGFTLVYLGLVAFYSFMFLKNYKPEEQDILEIFEEQF